MEATYDPDSRTYTITGMTGEVAHVLIWGGYHKEVAEAGEVLRQALVKAEDDQMPEDHYETLQVASIAGSRTNV